MKSLLVFAILLNGISAYSQEPSSERLKVFLEGSLIDFDYIRNSIKFVDFVNDPMASDVHVIISSQSTGGGGKHYILSYYGKVFAQIGDIVLSCYTFSFDTEEKSRARLTSSIKAGLLPYINEKTGAEMITINHQPENTLKDNNEKSNGEQTDPWKNWVFRIGTNGGLSGEEQRKNFDYALSLRAVKVTDKWKISNEYDYERRESNITKITDGVKSSIHVLRLEQDADIKAVFSINSHWSWGVFAQGTQNTYNNNKMSLELAPALEYNFFPWIESDRRRFTFSYYIGPSYNEYYETTILDKEKEWLWKESIEISLERIETWGDIDAWIEGGHIFPDFENYYYQAGLDIGIRVTRGFSFTFGLQAESIHNQRYLPASELSDEELLLNTRKLPTTFEYSGHIGIRFQFGSIYNNTVNERL